MKVFIDTNVLVSSFAFPGITRDLVADLVLKHEIYISDDVLRELRRILVLKLHRSSVTVDTFIVELCEAGTLIKPPFEEQVGVRDPEDIPILAAAIKSKAEILVTGDKDLLDIANPPIRMMRPRELYDPLTSKG